MLCLPVSHPISCSWGTSSCLTAVADVCLVLVVCLRLLFYLSVSVFFFMYVLLSSLWLSLLFFFCPFFTPSEPLFSVSLPLMFLSPFSCVFCPLRLFPCSEARVCSVLLMCHVSLVSCGDLSSQGDHSPFHDHGIIYQHIRL